jgi:hypothetical protein
MVAMTVCFSHNSHLVAFTSKAQGQRWSLSLTEIFSDEQRYERDRSASPRPMRDVRDRDRSMSPNGRAADRYVPISKVLKL